MLLREAASESEKQDVSRHGDSRHRRSTTTQTCQFNYFTNINYRVALQLALQRNSLLRFAILSAIPIAERERYQC